MPERRGDSRGCWSTGPVSWPRNDTPLLAGSWLERAPWPCPAAGRCRHPLWATGGGADACSALTTVTGASHGRGLPAHRAPARVLAHRGALRHARGGRRVTEKPGGGADVRPGSLGTSPCVRLCPTPAPVPSGCPCWLLSGRAATRGGPGAPRPPSSGVSAERTSSSH